MLKNLLFIFFILFSLLAMAQNTGTIRGKVVNSIDDQLENIEIRLVENNERVLTSKDGEFVFKNLPVGS